MSAEVGSLSPSELLMLAAYNGRTDALREALRCGADVNILLPSPSGPGGTDGEVMNGGDTPETLETPLHAAVRRKHLDCVRALLAVGGDTGRDGLGRSAWKIATEEVRRVWREEMCHRAGKGDLEGVKRLVEMGVEVNGISGNGGNTPMHWAASFGHADVVKALIFWDAEVDKTNDLGMTPLMDAAKFGNKEIVETLLKAGASPHLAVSNGTNEGKTAYELTEDDGVRNVLGQYLHSADSSSGLLGSVQSPKIVLRGRADDDLFSKSIPYIWPRPQRLTPLPTSFTFPDRFSISGDFDAETEGLELLSHFRSLLPRRLVTLVERGGTLQIATSPHLVSSPSAFRIHISSTRICLSCGDRVGLSYAVDLLTSFISFRILESQERLGLQKNARNPGAGGRSGPTTREVNDDLEGGPMSLSIPGYVIEDWPVMLNRAALIDLSNLVLKLDNLCAVLRRLSRLRYNEVHLNIATGKEFDREQFVYLKSACRASFLKIVPCIDISHFETQQLSKTDSRWTQILEVVRLLGGKSVRLNFGRDAEAPYDSSDADVSIDLIGQIYELLGRPVVYYPAGVLIQVLDACKSYEEEEEVLHRLPHNAVALVEAGLDTYKSDCATLRKHGLPFYVSFSTETCNSFAGRVESVLRSINEATHTVISKLAYGIVMCDWAGIYQLQPATASYPAFIAGAAIGWNPHRTDGDCLPRYFPWLIDWWYFKDARREAMVGKVIYELGKAPAELYDVILNFEHVEQISPNAAKMGVRKARRALNALRDSGKYVEKEDLACVRLMASYILMAAEIALVLKAGREEDHSMLVRRSDCCNKIVQCLQDLKALCESMYQPQGISSCLRGLEQVLAKMATKLESDIFLKS